MKTRIIAEVGANHGGDMGLAEAMIEAAAESGADFVKFQSWQARCLRTGDPNYDRHVRSELSDADHVRLIHTCERHGVGFLTTCFDLHRVEFLAGLGLRMMKVASPDCGSLALIRRLRDRFDHLIISTGMTPEEEVRKTASELKGTPFTYLHCVSMYPTPLERVNMARMDWLRQFTDSVGFSDHSLGTAAACLAIARRATYVEKHFTISRRLPGKDQRISCEPDELKTIAEFAVAVEKMEGEARPVLSSEELELRDVYVGKWGENRIPNSADSR